MDDKKQEATSIMLTAIENLANLFTKYQRDKEKEAFEFANKIDKLIYLAKRREERNKKIQNLKTMTDEEKKVIEKEDNEFDSSFIDTQTIVRGILSSPAGNDVDFLRSSTVYLRQKYSEKSRTLTLYMIQDMRDAYLIRLTQDAFQWDREFRMMLQKLMTIVQNVAMAYRQTRDEPQNESQQNQPNQNQNKDREVAEKYNQ